MDKQLNEIYKKEWDLKEIGGDHILLIHTQKDKQNPQLLLRNKRTGDEKPALVPYEFDIDKPQTEFEIIKKDSDFFPFGYYEITKFTINSEGNSYKVLVEYGNLLPIDDKREKQNKRYSAEQLINIYRDFWELDSGNTLLGLTEGGNELELYLNNINTRAEFPSQFSKGDKKIT